MPVPHNLSRILPYIHSKRYCHLHFREKNTETVEVTYPRLEARGVGNAMQMPKSPFFTVPSTIKAEDLHYTINFMIIM